MKLLVLLLAVASVGCHCTSLCPEISPQFDPSKKITEPKDLHVQDLLITFTWKF
tara:strand:- start:45 stop:206 length:162 start_codon:yes stop_codon:yes gene_type:complete